MNENLLLLTDSYKVTHHRQYPPGTEHVYSYFESRGGEFAKNVFFGLQYIILRYLQGVVVTRGMIDEAYSHFAKHFQDRSLFNLDGWQYIVDHHDGRLPISIHAVDEGSVIPSRNVLMTVENTDPRVPWLTNYLETILTQVWYPSTVATISREMKKTIRSALARSGDDSEKSLEFKLHDFGCRGSSSMESAAIGGAAHLVNFLGTDTLPSLSLLSDYYRCTPESYPGFSIPAAEHSTITSWGERGELEAYRNMLEQFPAGPVAIVSDSWDVYRAVREHWGRALRDEVLARDGLVVVRPDSGDPVRVVPELLSVLSRELGGATNDKGYMVLPECVRLIQGDGIDRHSIRGILDAVMGRGFSADNVAFGSGGGLLQDCNRDTSQYAFKASSIVVNGQRRDVFKRPATMSAKRSKKGRLALLRDARFESSTCGSKYLTVDHGLSAIAENQLHEVFRDGKCLRPQSLDEIRSRAWETAQ